MHNNKSYRLSLTFNVRRHFWFRLPL